ncbi:hypothetical protein [Caballeronia humi]|uniref:Uncharacterized protein n=1 Tax=Caballeronia humi TaxID=326474 RepID=A0A158GXL1_9BURK|nr:hypothetical protein [Caballeronia humi]SAL36230.1 hypothetical protein AWB65_02611 [Caballeronia humi]
MATELKTDAWHRYMLYRNAERYLAFELEETRKISVEAGRKFTASAYADVWAKDAELVKRVRVFLSENFHWHGRLANSGTDLDVVETLMDMVRGGCVVVIPEKPVSNYGLARAPHNDATTSFWGVEDYDPPRYASVQEQYEAQLAEWQANETPWEEIEAMNDEINAKFMHTAVLADPLGMLPLFARAGWISKYGLPDLSKWEEDKGKDGAVSPSTLLGDAQPFELGESTLSDEVTEIAARGVSEADEAECYQQFERDMDECRAYKSAMGGGRFMDMCSQRAFMAYQQCRGY